MIFTRFVGNYLSLSQELSSNIKAFVIEHRLDLVDTVTQNLSGQTLLNSLNLSQNVRVSKSLGLSASNSLTFSQYCHPSVIFQAIHQIIVIAQDAVAEAQWPLVGQTLVMTQLAVVDKVKGTSSNLALTQAVEVAKSSNLQASNTLALHDDTNVYKPSIFFISGES